MNYTNVWPALVLAILLGAVPVAQTDCGVVDEIGYPLDQDNFWVRYDFGLPSRRFNGRLHAGQDWFAKRGPSLGEPVHTIARGRVSLASPTVWGTDKGMVIVEHTMPDGSIWYSVYGHLEEKNDYTFPRSNTCVELGDVVGVIGDATPSPHLHFEIRNLWPQETGPGYWPVDPRTNGWLNPTEFIVNWQNWLRIEPVWRFDLWHDVRAPVPGLMGDDGTIFYFDGKNLFATTRGGQYIWYESMGSGRPIGLVRSGPERITVEMADGTMQDWSIYGAGPVTWQINDTPDGPPFVIGDLVLVHGTERGLMAYTDRVLVWEIAGVKRVTAYASDGETIGIVDNAGGFWLVDPTGRIIDEATFEQPAVISPAPDGVYLHGDEGIWQIASSGAWRWLADAPGVQPGRGRMISDMDREGFYLWAGGRERMLSAYDRAGNIRWQRTLPNDVGEVAMAIPENCPKRLVVATAHGYIAIFDTKTGIPLTEFRQYSEMQLAPFVGLAPDDQLLRLLIYDQLVTFDMMALAGPCQSP